MSKMRAALGRICLVLADIVVGAFVLGAELLRPLYRPLYDALSRLRLVRRLEAAIARLPRFAILALLAVPFLGVEPLKLVGVVWVAEGKVLAGLALLAGAYLGSFLLVERIYHAGREKLLTIGWLARAIGFVTRLREFVLTRLRASRAWRYAAAAADRIRTLIRRWVARRA